MRRSWFLLALALLPARPALAADVKVTADFTATPQAVRAALGDFCCIAGWHPDIASCRLSERGGAKFRTLRTARGQRLVERLDAWNSAGRFYVYRQDLSPLPVKDYVAILRVSATGDGARVEWSASFEPSGVPEEKAAALVTPHFRTGLKGLKAKF